MSQNISRKHYLTCTSLNQQKSPFSPSFQLSQAQVARVAEPDQVLMHMGSEFQLGFHKSHDMKICGGQRVSEIVLEGNMVRKTGEHFWQFLYSLLVKNHDASNELRGSSWLNLELKFWLKDRCWEWKLVASLLANHQWCRAATPAWEVITHNWTQGGKGSL